MRLDGIQFATLAVLLVTCFTSSLWCQARSKIIIDQDAAGPAGTDQRSILLLIQSPQTEVLWITVVTGDEWLKSEVAHTLRMPELLGRTDISARASLSIRWYGPSNGRSYGSNNMAP